MTSDSDSNLLVCCGFLVMDYQVTCYYIPITIRIWNNRLTNHNPMISAFRSSYETSLTNASEAEAVSIAHFEAQSLRLEAQIRWPKQRPEDAEDPFDGVFFGRREGWISSNLNGFPINFESLFGLGTLNETHFSGVDETWCKSMVPFWGISL